ncbi:Na-translocating system protein MpsC family protein [Salsuginibacillus kocurii]|uniref:Na-translocating system protein MpsC family protein n=1 Tax=Salsuginibacillus kocurii TaxID=427078 RepID=UPI00035E5DFF|nr:Na-translocating system protein MpsC family protein [Salsuginibacillus kocurii]
MSDNVQELDVKEKQKQIASFTGKELRDHFGRGPESVFVSLNESCIIMHMRNFLSPIEQVLIEQEGVEWVESLREIMMERVLPKIEQYLESMMDIENFEFFYDWNIEQKSGMIIGINWEATVQNTRTEFFTEAMKREIANVSEQAEKQPEHGFIEQVNPRMIIAGREGVLIEIEKELLSFGHKQTLQIAKRRLERRLLFEGRFDRILGVEILDIFVHWDFRRDRSLLVFVTEPTK